MSAGIKAICPGLARVLADVAEERRRQDEKWGPPQARGYTDVSERGPGFHDAPEIVAARHGIPTADVARNACEEAMASKTCSWAHVLTEELAEAVEVGAQYVAGKKLRKELVQIAAVAIAWIEDLDGRPPCHCQWEPGDSPCPLHGENEE
jgi:hypothetical protein